jgi:large subunit ribosomal protein L3
MLNGLLGKKLGMTQHFTEEGECIPVTVIQTGPVTVIQKKTIEKDGYDAVQIGFEPVKENKIKNLAKPLKNHFKEQAVTRYLKEFSADNISEIEVGQTFDVSLFEKGDKIDVTGTSKGRGFTGVVKRYNFKGGCASHGHRLHRGTGSIGQSATPAKVFKGKKMHGQHGNQRKTTQGLQVVDINTDLNIILVKGGVPGPNGRLVEVNKTSKG